MTDLEAQLEEAKKQNAALQIENTALRERLTKLEEQQTVWRKEIEEWRRGFRSRRKRFSSRGAHLLREAKQAAEVQGDVWAASFARGLRHAYRQGLVARKAQDQDLLERVRKSFWFLATTDRYAKSPTVVRLQTRMQKRFEGIVAFLGREDIPFTNNATERDLCPLCLHRKITGGTRSDEGSETLAHWMSVTQTLRKQNLNLTAWRVNAEVSRLAGRPVPSVFSTPNSAL